MDKTTTEHSVPVKDKNGNSYRENRIQRKDEESILIVSNVESEAEISFRN